MRMNLGRRNGACDRKNGTKNKVCGPEGPWYEMVWAQLNCYIMWPNLIFHPTSAAYAMSRQTLFFIPRPIDPTSLSCKHPSAHKPYFSYQLFEFMLRPVDPGLFSCKHPSGPQTLFLIPTFRAHAMFHRSRFVPMQVSFGPTNLIFHTTSCHPASFLCKHPLAHKPYFSYQLFEFMLHSRRPNFTLMQVSFGPQTLFFIPTFRAHATSRRPRFVLMQAPFRPTNLIFIPFFRAHATSP